jgi:hypothetical protein
MSDFFEDTEEVEKPKKIKQVAKVEDATFKYHMVDLPSNGKFGYPSTVEYRDILVKDEKVVASATPENFQKVLNGVLKGLLKDDSYFDKITTDDRDFLLTWIWANNYPTKRKLEYTCPKCDTTNIAEIDIVELDISELPDDFEIKEYTLKNGKTVKINPLTVRDEYTITEFSKSSSNEEWFVAQCVCINLGTVMPLASKIDYIENNISGYDMAKIRGMIKGMKYGVPKTTSTTCRHCKEENQIDIPFQVDFFLPTL